MHIIFHSIRIIPYENKKIHNDRVEDILCFRLCQIPTKYRTLHSNYFKLHNFVRLLLFFLQICLKIKFYYETTILHVISINHLSLSILWTSLIWFFFQIIHPNHAFLHLCININFFNSLYITEIIHKCHSKDPSWAIMLLVIVIMIKFLAQYTLSIFLCRLNETN